MHKLRFCCLQNLRFCGRKNSENFSMPSNTVCSGHRKSTISKCSGNRSLQTRSVCAPKILRIFERFPSTCKKQSFLRLRNYVPQTPKTYGFRVLCFQGIEIKNFECSGTDMQFLRPIFKLSFCINMFFIFIINFDLKMR